MTKSYGLEKDISFLKIKSFKLLEALKSSGLNTIKDLLEYYPASYIFREKANSINSIKEELLGQSLFKTNEAEKILRKEYALIVSIKNIELKSFGRKKLLRFKIEDDERNFAFINFWQKINFFQNYFKINQKLIISGKPEISKYGVVFTHPEIEKLDDVTYKSFKSIGILPIYSITKHMTKNKISSIAIRNLLKSVVDEYSLLINENLDSHIIDNFNFLSKSDTIINLHFPVNAKLLEKSKERMKFEEIFFFELFLMKQRSELNTIENGISMSSKLLLTKKLLSNLPFELTEDQKTAISQIQKDLSSNIPMNRMLQGDVGSGKTIVALLAMTIVLDNGYQSLIIAPTEILAKQHFNNISQFLKSEQGIVLLLGGPKTKEKKEILENIANGNVKIIIGTHALFQKELKYNKLALVVIDEQHRFGVEQRAILRNLGKISNDGKFIPHTLVMTATPIPRSLSMTAYGDLDLTLIKSKPKNRKEIITKIRFNSDLKKIYDFITLEVSRGRQAYIVYPLIEESEFFEDLKSVTEHYESLKNEVFNGINCGILHGKLHWTEKESIMQDFKNRKYDILFTTTVIEVGIDVPNATIMLVENAERFGLSQLHQLRGRVGRGEHKSYCILVTNDDNKNIIKSNITNVPLVKRLKAMEDTNDGFILSEIDLEIRGPGDILGTKQTGLPNFKFLDLTKDIGIISRAKRLASLIIQQDPNLELESYEKIKEELLKKKVEYVYYGTG